MRSRYARDDALATFSLRAAREDALSRRTRSVCARGGRPSVTTTRVRPLTGGIGAFSARTRGIAGAPGSMRGSGCSEAAADPAERSAPTARPPAARRLTHRRREAPGDLLALEDDRDGAPDRPAPCRARDRPGAPGLAADEPVDADGDARAADRGDAAHGAALERRARVVARDRQAGGQRPARYRAAGREREALRDEPERRGLDRIVV